MTYHERALRVLLRRGEFAGPAADLVRLLLGDVDRLRAEVERLRAAQAESPPPPDPAQSRREALRRIETPTGSVSSSEAASPDPADLRRRLESAIEWKQSRLILSADEIRLAARALGQPAAPAAIVRRPGGRFDLYPSEDAAVDASRAWREQGWHTSVNRVEHWAYHPASPGATGGGEA